MSLKRGNGDEEMRCGWDRFAFNKVIIEEGA